MTCAWRINKQIKRLISENSAVPFVKHFSCSSAIWTSPSEHCRAWKCCFFEDDDGSCFIFWNSNLPVCLIPGGYNSGHLVNSCSLVFKPNGLREMDWFGDSSPYQKIEWNSHLIRKLTLIGTFAKCTITFKLKPVQVADRKHSITARVTSCWRSN